MGKRWGKLNSSLFNMGLGSLPSPGVISICGQVDTKHALPTEDE